MLGLVGIAALTQPAQAEPADPPAEGTPPAEAPETGAPPPGHGIEFADDVDEFDDFDAPEYIIERIRVAGNSKTAKSVILGALALRAGDTFVEQRAELSRLKLLNLGYFTNVELSLARGSEPGRVELVVTVEERNTILIDAVDFGINTGESGFGDEDEPWIFGGLRLTEHNFLGLGVLVSAALAADDEGQQAYQLEVFEPVLADTRLQLGGSLLYSYGREYFRQDMDPPEGFRDATLNVRRIGGTLLLGWRFTPFTSFYGGYRFDAIGATAGHPNFFLVPEAKPGDDVPDSAASFSVNEGDSLLSAITLSMFHDARNDPFLPTSGGRADLDLELGTRLLGSDYDYTKFTFAYEHAFPTWLDHSIRLDLFLGLIHGKTPYFNKFFRHDLDLSPPRRLMGLDFYRENEFGDFAVSLGGEYNLPVFDTDGPFYRFVAFAGVDATMTGSIAKYFPREDPDQAGSQKTRVDVPIHLTFDLGIKVDTYIGVFKLSVSYFTPALRVVLNED